MLHPAGALLQRAIPGLILYPVGNMVPHDAGTMRRFLVDAHDAIAGLLEEPHNLAPAGRIVPVLALGRALHRDAHVRLRDRPRVVGNGDAWRHFGRIDAEY